MPEELTAGEPTTRRYSDDEKQAAVRMVRAEGRDGDDTRRGQACRAAARLRH